MYPLELIVAEAMKLTPDERAELIEGLIASFEPVSCLHPAWQAEIERRVADIGAGYTVPIPAEEVFSRIGALIATHDCKA